MPTAPGAQNREKHVSVRLLWPFFRVIGSSPGPTTVRLLDEHGISPAKLARPELRMRHGLAMELLDAWIEQSGDHEVGLRAGAEVEFSELDPLIHAARSCATFRESILCFARYFHLLHEAAEITLVEEGDQALWRFSVTDGVPQPRAANDFVVVAAAQFAIRYAMLDRPAREVHLMHPRPADTTGYAPFSSTKIEFGMPHNGFLLDRAQLDRPLRSANAKMHAAFETYARELSQRMSAGIRGQTREIVVAELRTGEVCMESVAAALSTSVPTLRRRLEQEGTTFTDLVDEVRRELAEQYLRDPRRSISEIAFRTPCTSPVLPPR
jgi:AraC-like DNA-binding protein